jgi:diguanylate cyclase (GGDEF)-like protein
MTEPVHAQFAELLIESIDEIVRRWVIELRRTERTERYNYLLTAEIVNGVKAVLATLAEAIEAGEMPDRDTLPLAVLKDEPTDAPGPPTSRRRAQGTKPLSGPFARATQAAIGHGRVRHKQGFELHEVIVEYVKLRQMLWNTLGPAITERRYVVPLELVQYVDRLLDELMLATLDSFYNSRVSDLEKRAVHEPLTGLYNKEYFLQRLKEEISRSSRSNEPITVAMMDMDLLKATNDTYGHQAGDAVIVAVAKALRDQGRQSDVPCRYGGDEFAVILTDTNKTQARAFADRIMRNLQNLTIMIAPDEPALSASHSGRPAARMRVHGKDRGEGAIPLVVPVPTISIGLASFPEDGRSAEMLVAKADAALYRAKREGRNRVAS